MLNGDCVFDVINCYLKCFVPCDIWIFHNRCFVVSSILMFDVRQYPTVPDGTCSKTRRVTSCVLLTHFVLFSLLKALIAGFSIPAHFTGFHCQYYLHNSVPHSSSSSSRKVNFALQRDMKSQRRSRSIVFL